MITSPRLCSLLPALLWLTVEGASPVWAQDFIESDECRLELQIDSNVDWNGPYGRGYDVFDADNSFEIAVLSIRHDGAACDYFLTGTVEDSAGDPALQGPAARLSYDVLQQPSGPSVLSPDYFGDQFSRVRGRFARGTSVQQVTLYVAVPPGQFVPGGSYSGRTVFRLFEDDPASPTLADQGVLGVIVPVASVLKVQSGDAGPGERDLFVDLGNLGGGADRTLDFAVASNAPVIIEATSANRGKLAHFAGAPGIEYQLWMGGRIIDLSQPAATQRIPAPGSALAPMPLRVAVDPQPGAAAGGYSDTLTVTFIVDG